MMLRRDRLQTFRLTSSAVQGSFMAVAMIIAGGFDYLVNIVAGRRLIPSEFFVFVTVTALLQVVVQATNVIRNVVAYYTAESTVAADSLARIGDVLRRSWRWAVRWGSVATFIAVILGPLLAGFLHIDTPWPLWAGALTVLLLFLRPVTDGSLQGMQRFWGLGSVMMLQSVLRLAITLLLIGAGLEATGVLLALPLASTVALLLALVLLRDLFRAPAPEAGSRPISWRYSAYTLLGLLAFAIMVNIDPIIVSRFFGEAAAEAYAPVVTLGKMNLFIPLGIGFVLFPKATQRQASGRDPRPVLLLALAATLLPGLFLTFLYWAFPAGIVLAVFGEAYADPGILLALVGLATTLYAGVSIWINYALSLERRAYIQAVAVIVVVEILAMLAFHGRLESIALIMIATGVTGNVAGPLWAFRNGTQQSKS